MQEFLPLGHKFSMGVKLPPRGANIQFFGEKNIILCMYKAQLYVLYPKTYTVYL